MSNVSEAKCAAAYRFRHSTVEAGDSTVTMRAASPDDWIALTTCAFFAAGRAFVTVTPAFVPTPVALNPP